MIDIAQSRRTKHNRKLPSVSRWTVRSQTKNVECLIKLAQLGLWWELSLETSHELTSSMNSPFSKSRNCRIHLIQTTFIL